MTKKKKAHVKETFAYRHRYLLLFSIVYIFLSICMFDLKMSEGGDNAVYVLLAESMIKGKGYKNIYLPDEPDHTLYPFGFPVLLTLPLLIFGRNIFILKIFIILTGMGALFFTYHIAQSLFRKNMKMVMVFMLSIPVFVLYNHWILTEIPYLCFSLGALYFFIRAQMGRQSFYYIAILFATYATFIRMVGITLVCAMVLVLIFKRQFKYALIFVVFFLLIFIPWQVRNASLPSEVSYVEQLLAKHPYSLELGRTSITDFLKRIFDNLVFYSFGVIPTTLLPIINTRVACIIGGLFFVIMIFVGLITRIKKLGTIEIYFIFGAAVMLVWPRIWSSQRFLLPLLPLFVLHFYYGLFWFSKKIKFPKIALVLTTAFVLLNIVNLAVESENAITHNIAYLHGERYAGYKKRWQHYFETIDWIGSHIPSDHVIMARKAEWVYFRTGNKSLSYPFTTDRSEVKAAIMMCDYILFDNVYKQGMARFWLLPVMEEEPHRYKIVYKTEEMDFFVIKVLK